MQCAIGAVVLLWMLAAVPCLHAQAITVKACTVLRARQSEPEDKAVSGTKRIQQALNLCLPGEAVVLEARGGYDAFTSAPLIIPRGVTLFVSKGVTLYAATNPRDYDLWLGSCGVVGGTRQGCKPFLFAYQAANSGVAGDGTIDGQGQRWWPLEEQAKRAKKPVSLPALVSSYESQNFSVRGLTLKNAPGITEALYKTIDFTAQGTRIEAAAGPVRGVLLSNSPGAKLSNLTIAVPGTALDLRASILGGTKRVSVDQVLIRGGAGISLGDDVYGSVHDISIADSKIKDARRGINFNLIGTRGGALHGVHLSNVCLSQVAQPLNVEQTQSSASHALPGGRDIEFDQVVVRGVGALQASGVSPDASVRCNAADASVVPAAPQWSVDLSTLSEPGTKTRLVVAQNGSGDFRSIQQAVNALPDTGGSIAVEPGVYREVVTIRKPHVHLYGTSADPAKTEIVFNNTGPKDGGTFNSATVFVEADNVTLDHLTIANDAGSGKGQAVALAVTADRAIFRHVRLLGAQDTLFAASKYCYGDYGPCIPARQYFSDCYIAGNTDFIFGDAEAVFDHCELHGIAGRGVMYTAQDRHNTVQPSGYVFDHCRLTASKDAGRIALGRPWRPHATVVFLNTEMDAPVMPAGWLEWPRFGVPSLPIAFYAEYHSTGPGADPSAREPYSYQLTAAEAAQWMPKRFLAGTDGWDPMRGDTVK